MKNLFWVRNRFSAILSFIGILGLLNLWTVPNQARTVSISFDAWIGQSPLQEIEGVNFFTHGDFSSQINDLIPSADWRNIKATTDFSAPVQSVGDWLVIMAKPHYGSPNDIVILIDRIKQEIVAICFGNQVYIISSNEIPGVVRQKMEIEYHLAGGHVITIKREVTENCANGDAKLAVQRWLQTMANQHR
jgi:hypothetical protein